MDPTLLYHHFDDLGEPDRTLAMGMLHSYCAKYDDDDVQCVAVEQHMKVPLMNLDTERKVHNAVLHGHVDKIVKINNKLYIMDHKTTSDDISDPNADYWRRLENDPQSTIYLLLALASGYDVEGIIWDVITKTKIRPRKLTKNEVADYEDDRVYCGQEMPYFPNGEYLGIELPPFYLARVKQWYAEHPEAICRRFVLRSTEDVYRANQSLVELVGLIRKAKRHGIWPQNFCACHDYGHQCEYYSVCHMGDTLDSVEFSDGDGDPFRLSHSGAKEFHECPRKYRYRRVDRRVKISYDDGSAVRLGRAWHKAMDEYWRAYEQESNCQ